ncbi:unnamed protein product [marine sediment metagenome]|uniref:Uncharacterized protein n=1 Tax=marine sediment metagenome TaxID=412755 RepID=X0WC10_9ZZZZ
MEGLRPLGQVGYSAKFKQLGPAQCQALNWMRDNYPETWVEVSGTMLQIMRPLRGRFLSLKGKAGAWLIKLLPSALESEEF